VQFFPGSVVGPSAGTNPGSSALGAFVNGDFVRISRNAKFTGKVCAPKSLLSLGFKSSVTGNLVALVISADRGVTVKGTAPPPPTTTSTLVTTSTTMTTLPGHCTQTGVPCSTLADGPPTDPSKCEGRDLSGCQGCRGNGTRDIGESCDKGPNNCPTAGLPCNSGCTADCRQVGECTGTKARLPDERRLHRRPGRPDVLRQCRDRSRRNL
jgi:hypothetical protein